MNSFLKRLCANISFFILFGFFISSNISQDELIKVGDWNLYIQGTFPKQSLYTKNNDSIIHFNEPYLLRFDNEEIDESKIKIKFIDSLTLNLQRYTIEMLEINNQDTLHTIVLNNANYEGINHLLPNLLLPEDIGLVKFNGGFEFYLNKDFLKSKIVIYIDHKNFSDHQYFSRIHLGRELKLDSLGSYNVLVTPQYNYFR